MCVCVWVGGWVRGCATDRAAVRWRSHWCWMQARNQVLRSHWCWLQARNQGLQAGNAQRMLVGAAGGNEESLCRANPGMELRFY